MNSKSPFYRYPLLYINGLKLAHGETFLRRYEYMASFVKKGDRVLEPGCGPAILADFLPKGSFYLGFDNNRTFIEYASKKGHDVHLGDVLDEKNYSSSEVVVVCDVIHHLKPSERKPFIRYCFRFAKNTLVICEEGKTTSQEKGHFKPLSRWWFEFIEKDGTNKPKLEDVWSKKTLLAMIDNGFGVIPATTFRATQKIGEDTIVAYVKNS